ARRAPRTAPASSASAPGTRRSRRVRRVHVAVTPGAGWPVSRSQPAFQRTPRPPSSSTMTRAPAASRTTASSPDPRTDTPPPTLPQRRNPHPNAQETPAIGAFGTDVAVTPPGGTQRDRLLAEMVGRHPKAQVSVGTESESSPRYSRLTPDPTPESDIIRS